MKSRPWIIVMLVGVVALGAAAQVTRKKFDKLAERVKAVEEKTTPAPVSREEVDHLKQDVQAVRVRCAELRAKVGALERRVAKVEGKRVAEPEAPGAEVLIGCRRIDAEPPAYRTAHFIVQAPPERSWRS